MGAGTLGHAGGALRTMAGMGDGSGNAGAGSGSGGRTWVEAPWLRVLGAVVLALVFAVVVPAAASDEDLRVDLILGSTTGLFILVTALEAAHRAAAEKVEKQLDDQLEEVEHRRAEMERRLMKRLDEVESQRFGALPLQRLLSVPEIEATIRDVVERAADVSARRSPFIAKHMMNRIIRNGETTAQIAAGVFRCADRREEIDLVQSALEMTEREVLAVAGLGLDHWPTPDYRNYFAAYLEHVPRVQQRRIFLVTDDDMSDPAMEEILQWHADHGVETVAVRKTEIPEDLDRPMVVFDESLILLHTRRSPDRIGAEVHFSDSPSTVARARGNFFELLRLARSVRRDIVLWDGSGTPETDEDDAAMSG